MSINQLLRAKRRRILAIARQHGARDVRIFGSVARGKAGPGSDIDFLVRLEPTRSLLDRVALKQDLEDLLCCPVDVVNERGLDRRIRRRVVKEALPL